MTRDPPCLKLRGNERTAPPKAASTHGCLPPSRYTHRGYSHNAWEVEAVDCSELDARLDYTVRLV